MSNLNLKFIGLRYGDFLVNNRSKPPAVWNTMGKSMEIRILPRKLYQVRRGEAVKVVVGLFG